MTSTVVAKRYAKALFAVAREEGKLEAYAQVLADINAFLSKSPDIEASLESPVFPIDLKHKVVEELVKAYGVDDVMANFLRLLVERGRIQHLRLIAEGYQELMDEEMGVVRAVVKTAVPLPEDLKEKMAEAFAQASGKKVVLQVQEDPEIIGGVVAHIGDMVWDGSIKSQLQGFKESIGRGELV